MKLSIKLEQLLKDAFPNVKLVTVVGIMKLVKPVPLNAKFPISKVSKLDDIVNVVKLLLPEKAPFIITKLVTPDDGIVKLVKLIHSEKAALFIIKLVTPFKTSTEVIFDDPFVL